MVYIESQENIFNEYGVIDGPIDMVFIYAYCIDNNIPVKMIDYWTVDDNFMENQNNTSDERDNQIFYNIYEKLKTTNPGDNVLICYGSAHFFYQKPRMKMAGFLEQTMSLDEEISIFKHNNEKFEYPSSMYNIIENSKKIRTINIPSEC